MKKIVTKSILWIGLICLSIGHTYAQKVNLSFTNVPLINVLNSIKSQTGMTLVFSEQLVDVNRKVSIRATSKDLPIVMKELFANTNVNFEISNKKLYLTEKKEVNQSPHSSLKKQADEIKVKGRITNEKGEPIIGVSIFLKNKTSRTVSNANGFYEILMPTGEQILILQHVSYLSKEITTKGRQNIDVILSEIPNRLDEVVVVGYGTQTKGELTGSVSSIKEELMDKFAGGSLINSMQGKVAGLRITSNSGEPGAAANITLRGVSSISGSSQPLYIIDGVIIENNSYTSQSEDQASFSPLNDLNPSDIASIEVLKDAGTASIYGAMASNGVVLITTKTGASVPKPTIGFGYNSGFVHLSRKIGTLNAAQFREANYEANLNAKGSPPTRVPLYDSLHPYYRESHDWQNIMYRTSYQQKLDLNLRGSSSDKNVSYYVSMGYRDLPPIMVETKYKQFLSNTNVNYKFNKFIRGTTGLNISNTRYNRQDNGVIFRYLTTMPFYSPYDPITGQLIPMFEGAKANPLARVKYETNEIKRWNFIARQELMAQIIKGLEFKTVIALNHSNTEASYYWPPILSPPSAAVSSYSDFRPETLTLLDQSNTLTYTKRLKKHNLTALLGQSFRLVNTKSTYVRGIDNIDHLITSISGSGRIKSFSQNEQENALLSYFTRINYNYDAKYLFSFVMRRDGSSRFGSNNRIAYFPSVSGSWRFSKEKFIHQRTPWLNDGKIRASYGITGNQFIGNYVAQGTIGRVGSYLDQVALMSTSMPNKDLKWETTKQMDIGADLSFLKGRLTLTADYYIKNSNDLLFSVQIPSQTGYSTIPFNFGSLSNKGFELDITGVIINKALKWTSTLTFGTNKNKVKSLPGNEDYRPNAFSLARVNEPVGVFYGYKALGIYARDEDNIYVDNHGITSQYRRGSINGDIYKGGDVRFDDVNKDGIIDLNDWQIIGDPTPKGFGGLQNSFEYKRFTLDVFVNYVFGNKVFNQLWRNQDSNQWEPNYSSRQLRRWRRQGDVTDIPRLVLGDPMQNYAVSSMFLEDGSFIRLQNISLSYKIAPTLLKKIGLQNADIGINAQNLMTFGSYSGYDPEVSSGTNPFGVGVDYGAFPKNRSFNMSVNIKF